MIPLHSVHVHVIYTSVHVYEYMYMYVIVISMFLKLYTYNTVHIFYSYIFIFSLLLIYHIDSLFDALACFLLFNSADFVGRYLSNWFNMVRTNVHMYRRLYFFLSFIIKRDTCPEKIWDLNSGPSDC